MYGRCWRNAKLTSEREHVTAYIYNHPEKFRIAKIKHTQDLSMLRWTVDEPGDLAFVRSVFQHMGSSDFG